MGSPDGRGDGPWGGRRKSVFRASALASLRLCCRDADEHHLGFHRAERCRLEGVDLVAGGEHRGVVAVRAFAAGNREEDCARGQNLLGCETGVLPVGEDGLAELARARRLEPLLPRLGDGLVEREPARSFQLGVVYLNGVPAGAAAGDVRELAEVNLEAAPRERLFEVPAFRADCLRAAVLNQGHCWLWAWGRFLGWGILCGPRCRGRCG